MVSYEVTTIGGSGFVTHDPHDKNLVRAMTEHRATSWEGGSGSGIFEDWGRQVDRKVKEIKRYNDDGTVDVLYDAYLKRKLNAKFKKDKELRQAQTEILSKLAERIIPEEEAARKVAYATGKYDPVAEARASAYGMVLAMITGFKNDLL